MKNTNLTLACILTAALTVPALADSPPELRRRGATVYAAIVTSAEDGLADAFDAIRKETDGTAWVGYVVPSRPGTRMGCGNSDRKRCLCKLSKKHRSYTITDSDDGNYPGSDEMMVLYLISDGEIDRIRSLSMYCAIDPGSTPFHWLTDADPVASIALLESVIHQSHRNDDLAGAAVSTIAMHDNAGVLDALEKFIDRDMPCEVREQAVFWIGETGGRDGVKILQRVLYDDASTELQEQAIFALSINDAPEAIDAIITAARKNPDAEVREQAVFWLSQKASDKAVAAIADVIENDPDDDVKEQAVFALSQLPNDESVPLLIRVAKKSRNRKVREQAIFWLAQSGDDRALDYFEEVLSR